MVNKQTPGQLDGNFKPHTSELHSFVADHGRGRCRGLDLGKEEALLVDVVVGALAAAVASFTNLSTMQSIPTDPTSA